MQSKLAHNISSFDKVRKIERGMPQSKMLPIFFLESIGAHTLPFKRLCHMLPKGTFKILFESLEYREGVN